MLNLHISQARQGAHQHQPTENGSGQAWVWRITAPTAPIKQHANPIRGYTLDPHSIVRWIDTARNYKDLNNADETATKTIRASFPTRHEELLPDAEHPPARSTLLAARVRLHSVAMLFHRRRWHDQVNQSIPISRSLGIDSSPQVGLELLGGVVDSIVDSNISTLFRITSQSAPLAWRIVRWSTKRWL